MRVPIRRRYEAPQYEGLYVRPSFSWTTDRPSEHLMHRISWISSHDAMITPQLHLSVCCSFTHETTVRIGKPTIEEASDEEADNNIAKAAADAQKEEDLKELDACLAGIETFCGKDQSTVIQDTLKIGQKYSTFPRAQERSEQCRTSG